MVRKLRPSPLLGKRTFFGASTHECWLSNRTGPADYFSTCSFVQGIDASAAGFAEQRLWRLEVGDLTALASAVESAAG
jgi:hypothetical protein